ncbi:hypothetical protein XA68_15318 [Ophiocordyceps unilateralis]|uniref:Uncharacterized protein n=1 Tax=Ophiocordyceps unilateralis TaxID=268505 RepID=A0A2A9P8H7_OPHUN|nr:hypothetical protein XA68_15318 [Ophiocordyceps unilateralis]
METFTAVSRNLSTPLFWHLSRHEPYLPDRTGGLGIRLGREAYVVVVFLPPFIATCSLQLFQTLATGKKRLRTASSL